MMHETIGLDEEDEEWGLMREKREAKTGATFFLE